MNALKNLPKTLDETYDRVFATIPEDEHLFVHHVLEWIAYHNELHGDDIGCEILIQAAEASTKKLMGEQIDRFYDQNTLQELCGCLIAVSPAEFWYTERAHFTVKFAHYTVFEYLESGRILKSASARHDAVATPREHLIEVTLLEAQKVECQSSESMQELLMAQDANFTNYCVASGTRCLSEWPDRICQQSVLRRLVVDFLNPSKPHFETVVTTAEVLEDPMNLSKFAQLWEIDWNPGVSTDAKHLYYVLLLYEIHHAFAPLIKDFLRENDQRHLLQSRLTFWQDAKFCGMYHFEETTRMLFDGSFVEVLAQQHSDRTQFILFLTEIGAGLLDPSVALLLSVSGHGQWHEFEKTCLVQRILELGADPNLRGYILTPIQIATYCLDFEAVGILLEHGAHPSSIRYMDGAAWEQGTKMSYFHHLHGASPLRILKRYTYTSHKKSEEYNKTCHKEHQKLEELLLQYGAEDISSTPDAELEEVKYDLVKWRAYSMAIPHVQAHTNHQWEEDLSATSADDSF